MDVLFMKIVWDWRQETDIQLSKFSIIKMFSLQYRISNLRFKCEGPQRRLCLRGSS